MFDNIAPSYDFLNMFLSAGQDRRWRRRAVGLLGDMNGRAVLDIATGTGDIAFTLLKANPRCHVTGIDLAPEMIRYARQKAGKRYPGNRPSFKVGDSENLPFKDNSFDAVTVAFGVRNFENLGLGLREMRRVLKPGGKVVVLEFTRPRTFPVKQLFGFYFRYLLPIIGGVKSGDQKAYKYLHDSVQAFPDYDDFLDEMAKAGFVDGSYQVLSTGICAIYQAGK